MLNWTKRESFEALKLWATHNGIWALLCPWPARPLIYRSTALFLVYIPIPTPTPTCCYWRCRAAGLRGWGANPLSLIRKEGKFVRTKKPPLSRPEDGESWTSVWSQIRLKEPLFGIPSSSSVLSMAKAPSRRLRTRDRTPHRRWYPPFHQMAYLIELSSHNHRGSIPEHRVALLV
jgi:hypothetical protein